VSNLSVATGADTVGNYSEIGFDFQTDAARHATIRAYGNQQVVLFTLSNPSGSPNTTAFPNWIQYPHHLQQLTYSGIFAPPVFNNPSTEGPWVFFDSSAKTFIVSPASHFMVSTTGWGPNGELASGISTQINTLPQGFQQRTFLVIGEGINRTFDAWGHALTGLVGKTRPANDADVSLKKIGYWTDNGSTYYYQTSGSLSYQQTLASVKANFDSLGIGLGYIQLDSWFYPKGPNAEWTANGNGIYQYLAAPALFPDGLGNFRNGLGVSLITHARWIDPSSPYRQLYAMSGNVVTDPSYWSSVAQYLASSGVSTYEQDWLDDKAQTAFDLTNPDLFLGNMAAALSQQGLTIQYCMASARHFLHSVLHNNVVTIRTSEDRMQPWRWLNFLYTSRLASALGLWPFTDTFLSTETNNLLLATLSAGPIGIGDPIGAMSGANLLHAVRADGVIVKPDAPLTPIDSSYLGAAQAPDVNHIAAPQVASTYTDFGGLRAFYILAYSQGATAPATLHLSDFGMDRTAYVYDYFAGRGRIVNPADVMTVPVAGNPVYLVAAPVGHSGIAVLGDLGQFVPLGHKRVASLSDRGVARLTVNFAAGEQSRVISGYSPEVPTVQTVDGTAGRVTYDASTGLFAISIKPGADGIATLVMSRPKAHDPVRAAPTSAGIQ